LNSESRYATARQFVLEKPLFNKLQPYENTLNYKRKSRCRFFLLVRSKTPPISSEFREGGLTPQTPRGTPMPQGPVEAIARDDQVDETYRARRRSAERFSLTLTEVFRDFLSVVRQMPGYMMQSLGTARTPSTQARRLQLSA